MTHPLLKPWRGGRCGPAIVVTASDLKNASGVSEEAKAGCWRLERYVWGSRSGAVLAAAPEFNPAPIRVAPRLQGGHVLTLGLYHPREAASRLYARIHGDDHFTHVSPLRVEVSFERVTLGVADMTGRAVELASFGAAAWLDYVEFTPVLDEDEPSPTADLLGFVDFAVDAPVARPPGREAASAVRRHVEAGFTMLAWKAFAVRCEYWTRVGERRGAESPPGLAGPSVGKLLESYDTLRQAVDEAKRLSIPILGWARINNEFSKPLPHPFSPTTPFHLAHPEKVQLARDGRRRPRLSLAYPEVREHKAAILAEIAGYGVDGILIDTLRHPPMAQYDQPLLERFMAEGGDDPRKMENDGSEAWLRFRARHAFTQFLIEAREKIDAAAQRRLPIYVRVHDQPWVNLAAGCDIQDWIERGLVEGLIAAPWIAEAKNYPESLDPALFGLPTRVFAQAWRYGSMAQAIAIARQAYDDGAHGVAVYDSELAIARPGCREHLWRLAHRDLVTAGPGIADEAAAAFK